MLFNRLRPVSLVVSTLWLLVGSSPLPVDSKPTPELRQLTGANFKTSVEHNDWFVEFFSPLCPHCTAFKPTWERLVDSRDDPPRLNLAQVNCVADGDLCTSEKVQYYPFLRLYRRYPNGTQTTELFTGSRTLQKLEAWLDEHVPKPPPTPNYPVPTLDAASLEHPLEKPKYNTEGRVLELTEATFQEKVASEPTFVKFFAPWCGHCQKLAPKWIELASELKGVVNIAEVNCDLYGSICRNAGVEGYPTLAFYINGKKVEYTGSKNVPAMSSFVQKAVAPGVVSVDAEEFGKRLEDEEVIYLLLHSGSDKGVVNIVQSAALTLLGEPPILASTSRHLYTQYGLASPSTSTVPVLLAIKAHSPNEYTAKLELDGLATGRGQDNAERLERWLQKNRFPYVSKLSMDNFYSVMKNPTNPFVVLLAVDPGPSSTKDGSREDEGRPESSSHPEEALSHRALSQVKALAGISEAWSKEGGSKGKTRETVFVWMDGRRWGRWLKNMYGIKDVSEVRNADGTVGGGVSLVIVDHGALLYYDVDSFDQPIRLSQESVFSALNAIYTGKSTPKHSESMLERIARNVNNRLIALEEYVSGHVKTTIFSIMLFFVLLFYGLRWLFNSDLPGTNEYYVSGEEKKERGRLD